MIDGTAGGTSAAVGATDLVRVVACDCDHSLWRSSCAWQCDGMPVVPTSNTAAGTSAAMSCVPGCSACAAGRQWRCRRTRRRVVGQFEWHALSLRRAWIEAQRNSHALRRLRACHTSAVFKLTHHPASHPPVRAQLGRESTPSDRHNSRFADLFDRRGMPGRSKPLRLDRPRCRRGHDLSGGDRIRLDCHRIGWRVVVDQLAT